VCARVVWMHVVCIYVCVCLCVVCMCMVGVCRRTYFRLSSELPVEYGMWSVDADWQSVQSTRLDVYTVSMLVLLVNVHQLLNQHRGTHHPVHHRISLQSLPVLSTIFISITRLM